MVCCLACPTTECHWKLYASSCGVAAVLTPTGKTRGHHKSVRKKHALQPKVIQPESSRRPCDMTFHPISQRKFLNYEPDLVSSSTKADSHHPDFQASDTATT